MTDRIDIADPLAEICERLGLEPRFVGTLTIAAGEATALVYRRNENGAKYIDLDTNLPATDCRAFKVLT